MFDNDWKKLFVSEGPHSCGMPWSYCITSVGKEVTGFSTKLADQNENGEGEVNEPFIFHLLV